MKLCAVVTTRNEEETIGPLVSDFRSGQEICQIDSAGSCIVMGGDLADRVTEE